MVLSDKSLLLTLLLLVVVVEDAILNGNVVDGLECTEDTTNERLDRGEVMAKQRTMDVNAVNTAALLGMFVDVPFVRSLIGRQKEFIASHTHTQGKSRKEKRKMDPIQNLSRSAGRPSMTATTDDDKTAIASGCKEGFSSHDTTAQNNTEANINPNDQGQDQPSTFNINLDSNHGKTLNTEQQQS